MRALNTPWGRAAAVGWADALRGAQGAQVVSFIFFFLVRVLQISARRTRGKERAATFAAIGDFFELSGNPS
jgi:hypothetical protein